MRRLYAFFFENCEAAPETSFRPQDGWRLASQTGRSRHGYARPPGLLVRFMARTTAVVHVPVSNAVCGYDFKTLDNEHLPSPMDGRRAAPLLPRGRRKASVSIRLKGRLAQPFPAESRREGFAGSAAARRRKRRPFASVFDSLG